LSSDPSSRRTPRTRTEHGVTAHNRKQQNSPGAIAQEAAVLSRSVNRGFPRGSCPRVRRGVAAGFLVALLTAFGFADFAFGEIIANLQPITGASGNSADTASYYITDINAAGGIAIGDLLFDSFTVTSSSSGNAIAPTASSIEITAVDVNGDYGFRVNSSWLASGGQSADTTITFHASLLPNAIAEGQQVVGNALYTTGVGGAGTTGGIASISENLYAQYSGSGGSSFADEFNYYISSTNKQTLDTATFAPLTDFWVVKDVSVSGGAGSGGVMSLSEFYETFHEMGQQAPEPSTLALSAVGLLGLAAFTWRKRCSVLRPVGRNVTNTIGVVVALPRK
jgi:hypothetical protein